MDFHNKSVNHKPFNPNGKKKEHKLEIEFPYHEENSTKVKIENIITTTTKSSTNKEAEKPKDKKLYAQVPDCLVQ